MKMLTQIEPGSAVYISCALGIGSLLILRIEPPENRPHIHLLCGLCETFPTRWRWTSMSMCVYEISESLSLVADAGAGLAILCGSVHIRENFDLRHYLRVEDK